MSEQFLVTGAMGCLGSWTVKRLVDEGNVVTALDLADDPYRLRLIADQRDVDKVNFVVGDVADLATVERVISDARITHILHLAALQVPFCRADPVLGMRVNVIGTTAILEAARRCGDQIEGLVYCSSAAAYGASAATAGQPVAIDAPRRPDTIYGVTKVANEETARIYWQDHGVSSIGLRPHTVYGVGRDQGMTSTPTKAMLAAAAGRPYDINMNGVWTFHHADDAAACLIRCVRADFDGADVFNMGGNIADMSEVVAAIEHAEHGAAGTITVGDQPLPLPSAFDDSALTGTVPGISWRPLIDGVAETVEAFGRLIKAGAIDVDHGLS